MTSPVQEYPLRSLTIGEIFDRAVTIYVRNFVVFSLIVLTLILPLTAAQYAVSPDQSTTWQQILSGHAAATPAIPVAQQFKELFGLFIVVGIALLVAPLVNNAVAIGVAALYRGERPSYGACFRASFRRYGQALVAMLLALSIFIGLYVALIFLLVILIAVGVAFVKSALPLAVAVFVVAGALLLAFIFLCVLLLIVYALALYSTAIENLSPVAAVSSAFRRLLSRGEIGKACLIALAYVGLQLGVGVMASAVSVTALVLLKSDPLYFALSALFNAALTSFLTIVLAVYYYDVRTRFEGLDLEVELARLNAGAT
jgi:hypothetical protein